MNFEEALRIELNTIPDLTNKVFPLTAIEGVKAPYLVYVSSEGVPDKCLEGYGASKEVDCELHILHDTYSSLKDMTRKVIALIVSFQGRVIGGNGGLWIQDVTYQKITEQYIDQLFQYLSVISLKVRFDPNEEASISSPTWNSIQAINWNNV